MKRIVGKKRLVVTIAVDHGALVIFLGARGAHRTKTCDGTAVLIEREHKWRFNGAGILAFGRRLSKLLEVPLVDESRSPDCNGTLAAAERRWGAA